MTQKPLDKSVMMEAVDAVEIHGSVTEAAVHLGIPRNTLQGRIARAKQEGIQPFKVRYEENKGLEIPILPDEEISADELIDRMTDSFQRRKRAKEHRKWINVKAKSNDPICLAFLGDPHVDDNGCDWPTLRRHVEIIKNTEGMHGCSVGDQHNNWVGRLARLYSKQDTSAQQAWLLVEWLIKAIDPLILIAGNHDMWTGAGDPVKWMRSPKNIYEDWQAKVRISFPNGTDTKIFAAHDMAGHSMWNQLHGQMKAAKFTGDADLYISGHKHTWALSQIELPSHNRTPWLARARGYKFMDEYATVKGYEEQNYGHAIGVVIDPEAELQVNRMTCFADLEQAADFLKWKRSKKS